MKLKNQSGFVVIPVVAALVLGLSVGFVGTKAHENYMGNHPAKAEQCLSTDISTSNSTCQLPK